MAHGLRRPGAMTTRILLVPFLVPLACGGGTALSTDGATGMPESGRDVAAGPCNPYGRWRLHYTAPPADGGGFRCVPEDDVIAVGKVDGGGGIEVVFEGREPGSDSCTAPPKPGT